MSKTPTKFDEAAFAEAVSHPNGWDEVADPVAEIRRLRGDQVPGDQVTPQGNAAAMRAALEAVLAAYASGAIHTCAEHYRDEWDDELCDLKAKVESALAAPQRNCDRHFPDRVAMYSEFKDWCNAKGHTIEPKLAGDAFDWLFATAEGGSNNG